MIYLDKFIACLFVLSIISCGLYTAKYEEYSTQTPKVSECEVGLEAFKVSIQPAIEESCIACHASTPIASSPLTTDPKTNRTQILLYDESTDGSTLFEKISSASKHGGNDQTNFLSLDHIQAWKEAEQNCTSE